MPDSQPVQGAAPRRPAFFSGGPSSRQLYSMLLDLSGMRLQRRGGRAFAAVLTNGLGLQVLPVESREFVRFVDDMVEDEGQRRPSQRAMKNLIRMILNETRAPDFRELLPTVRIDGAGPAAYGEPSIQLPSGGSDVLPLDLSQFKIVKDPEYVPQRIGATTDIDVLGRSLKAGLSVLIEGPPGSGKTQLARALAFRARVPFIRYDLADSWEPEDAIGKFVRRGGTWGWAEGGIPAAMVAPGGALLFLDELNAARRESISRLHRLLDSKPPELFIPEHAGELCRATKSFGLVAAQNPSTDFARLDRLRSRLDAVLTLDYSREVETKLCPDPAVRGVVWKLREIAAAESWVTPVSTRLLVDFRDNVRVHGPELARALLVNAFALEERDAVARIVTPGGRTDPRTQAARIELTR